MNTHDAKALDPTTAKPGRRSPSTTHRAKPLRLVPAATALAVLTACGGGSSSSDTGGATEPLSVAGTVAADAAITGAQVSLKCVGGNGTATSKDDGTYSVTLVAGAALPCMLAASTPSGALYSVATGSGSTARANITPATDLVVAQLYGMAPATVYAGFDGGTGAAALSSSAVSAASSTLVGTLKSAGIDLSGSGDLVGGALVPGSSGNAYGQALAALSGAMSNTGTTQAALESAIAQGSGNATVAALSNVPSLPAELLLKAKAPNCASLRSGTYRWIDFNAHRDESTTPSGTLALDAATLTITEGSGGSFTLTPAGTCRYQSSGLDVSVTAAGVLVIRSQGDDYSGSNNYVSIAFPAQSHTVAELAGDWNSMAYDRDTDGSALTLRTSTLTFDANGKVPSVLVCGSLTGGCSAPPDANRAALALSVNSGGGFDFSGNGWTNRVFVYRAGGGELMAMSVNGSGGISLLTRKASRTAPSVGTVTEQWNYYTSPIASGPWLLSLQAADQSRNTIVSVDTAQSRFVRDAVFNFSTGATVPQTIVYNDPREGFLRRLPAVSVTRSDGSTGNVTEWVSLPMRGMGFSAVGLTADNRLDLSPSLGD